MSAPGEGALRGDITNGMGVFRSSDSAARPGTHVGLTRHPPDWGSIVVDPTNPDIALVAAIGHAFGPNAERGVFRTIDGGKTWTKVLYKDDRTPGPSTSPSTRIDPKDRLGGAVDRAAPAVDLLQRRTRAAASIVRPTAGATWSHITGNGLPDRPPRPDRHLGVRRGPPPRLRHGRGQADGGLYRSDDAGVHWARVSQDGRIRQRAWYFSKIYADPKSGGHRLRPQYRHAALDRRRQDLQPCLGDPRRPPLAVDQSERSQASWSIPTTAAARSRWTAARPGRRRRTSPPGAFYHVATDMRFPYWVYGAQQDNSNLAVASFDRRGCDRTKGLVRQAGGGESGFVVPDPRDAADHLQRRRKPVRPLRPPRHAGARHQS